MGRSALGDMSPSILESKVLSFIDFLSFFFYKKFVPRIFAQNCHLRSQNPGSAPDILLLVHPVVCRDVIMIIIILFLYYRLGIILHQRGHGHSHGIPEKKAKSKKPQASPSSFIIVEEEEENVNVRAAFIHVLGDFLQSVGVFVAALLIWFEVSDLLHFTWLPSLL